MKNEQDIIILKLKVKSSLLVGYGKVFKCEVMKVRKGTLIDEEINLVVLPQNKALYEHIESVKIIIEMDFKKMKCNEPYPIMPINGFVDNAKTSWEIISTKN